MPLKYIDELKKKNQKK